MSHLLEVGDLIAQACQGKVLILTRREFRILDRSAELPGALRELAHHDAFCGGSASRNLFGDEQLKELGDAPAWFDAGALFEGVAAALESKRAVDFVFCLDPWAAQLLGSGKSIAQEARWIFVSDLAERKAEGHKEYWNQMEEWFASQPFMTIIPRSTWDQSLAEAQPQIQSAHPARDPGVHLEKFGAWQWRRISAKSPEAKPVLFLVQFSGSLPRMRVFLDSLARQDYPQNLLYAALLLKKEGNELATYLRWFALAHPDLKIDTADSEGVNSVLDRHRGAVLVLSEDSVVLPAQFARAACKAALTTSGEAMSSVILSLEATAHIVTGNLDPLPSYDSLLSAFRGTNSQRAAQVLPVSIWDNSEGFHIPGIKKYAQEAVPDSELSVLQLAELK